MSGVTDSYREDKHVVTAIFNTLGGANLAVKKLESLEKEGVLDVENTITVSKNAWDKLDVHQTTGDSAREGAKVGALVGGVLGLLFPPSILVSAAIGAGVGAMAGVLRGSGFDDTDVKAMADELQPGQSMMIAVVDPRSYGEVQAALEETATKIGWTVMPAAAAEELLRHGKEG